MAEWLVEEGIGEHRAIRLDNGRIVAAQVRWPGELTAGQIEDARLITRTSGSSRGTALLGNGTQVLVNRLSRSAGEGAMLRVEITRGAIAEEGRMKLAQGRPTERPIMPAPGLADALLAQGHDVRTVHSFPGSEWEDLMAEAFALTICFSGGSIHFSPTPAMTLIDVDGSLPAKDLAIAAIPAIAAALPRFDIGGPVGIDFPTVAEKTGRRTVDKALASAMQNWPHECTAMNGFGFVQLVARLERPSILQRLATHRAAAAARLLLRQAERVREPGLLLLTAHPAIRTKTMPEWERELARRTGREIRWQSDPSLALEAGFAQAVAR